LIQYTHSLGNKKLLGEIIMGIDFVNLKCSLFNGLSSSELDQIAAVCQEQVYKAGELIAMQGILGNELFIIDTGCVEILVDDKTNPNLKSTLAILGKGQIIGEMGMMDQTPRPVTVRAMDEPTIIQIIPYVDIQALCQKNTQIGFTVMSNLAAEISLKLRRVNYPSF